ncbi:unnamed protein product [Clavelina lepadiformis]|uniref:RRP15-like protein n=1 Tax=Clavelina lepadiformis TaxID=159417 RepID=A0ABP0FNM3_CLALP
MGVMVDDKMIHDEIEEEENGNVGWADAMSKVLGKQGPKDAESLILAKSKVGEEEDEEEEERRERRRRLKKKRKWESMNYVKPSVLEKDYERTLQKTATRGVIQLFNTVKKHKREMEEKLKTANTEGKKEKIIGDVDKGKFLDMLKEDTTRKSGKREDDSKPAWAVLQDDFMLGSSMKDWDKRSDDDEDDTVEDHEE